jgi:hypothetical protein
MSLNACIIFEAFAFFSSNIFLSGFGCGQGPRGVLCGSLLRPTALTAPRFFDTQRLRLPAITGTVLHAHLRLAVFAAFIQPASLFAGFAVWSAGGDNTSFSIQASVDQFRLDLGDPNNLNSAGPLPSGRREINWDGGGSTATTSVGSSIFTGFINNRGATFATPGTDFVQAPLSGFDTTNPTYSTTFQFFSPLRLFSPVGSNITDVTFFIPGTNGAIPATVDGFGAVFTDVDLVDSTRLQFFDSGDNQIFDAYVPAGTVASGSLSFLGAAANAGEQISRVRITAGTTSLGPTDDPAGGVDMVAIDDVIYGEPIPEPTVTALLALAAAIFGRGSWRR